MNPAVVILAVLFCTSTVLSLTMGLAWRDLGRPRHALTWSIAFGVASFQWIVNATGLLLFPKALPYIAAVSALSLTSSALCAIGCRQRACLPDRYAWFAGGVVAFTALTVFAFAKFGGSYGAVNCFGGLMFGIAALAVFGRQRWPTPGETVLIGALLLFAVLELFLTIVSVAQSLVGTQQLLDIYRLVLGLGLACGYIATGVAAVFLLATDLAGQMRALTISDPLTGVYNRRGFEQAAARAITMARLYGQPLAVIVADLDGFKAINDRHGHAAGDDVLRRFASHVANALRRGDMIGRLGGEEFGILLGNTDGTTAIAIVDRIRSEVAAMSMGGDVSITITCSFGIAELTAQDKDVSSALNRADLALYRAKTEGRNRVVLNEAEPALPPPRRGIGKARQGATAIRP